MMVVVVCRGRCVLVVLDGGRQDHGQLGEHVALLLLRHGSGRHGGGVGGRGGRMATRAHGAGADWLHRAD